MLGSHAVSYPPTLPHRVLAAIAAAEAFGDDRARVAKDLEGEQVLPLDEAGVRMETAPPTCSSRQKALSSRGASGQNSVRVIA